MSYLKEVQLKDVDESHLLECTCKGCLHTWCEKPTDLLLKVMHRDVYLDQVADNLACTRPGCTYVGVYLSEIDNKETTGFVGGMP